MPPSKRSSCLSLCPVSPQAISLEYTWLPACSQNPVVASFIEMSSFRLHKGEPLFCPVLHAGKKKPTPSYLISKAKW